MKKNLVITDLHFGANNNNHNYHDYQKSIFNSLINFINDNDVERMKIIGDLFHHKKLIDVYILDSMKEMFKEIKIPIDIVLGNHDQYYSNSNEVTSVNSLKEFTNINIISKITCITENNKKIMYVPYPNTDEMKDEFIKQVDSYNPDILYGHFDVSDFYLANNIKINNGFSVNLFKNIPLVVLGHIHLKQHKNNINYIGPPWDINWGDSFSSKGFYTIENGTIDMKFHDQKDKYFQYYKVDENNYKEIINNITNNPNREFKFKLTEDNEEFVNFIENEFEKPENVKSLIVENTDDEEVIEVSDSLSTKEIIDEQIKHDNVFDDKDLAFSILNHLDTNSLTDIKSQEIKIF